MSEAAAAPGAGAPKPDRPRREGGRVVRWGSLALAVLIGCGLGGWQRHHSGTPLTSAARDQVTVRLGYDLTGGYFGGCLAGDVSAKVELPVPLLNDGPGPVSVRSATINSPDDFPGARLGTAQNSTITIGAGKTVVVNLTIPASLCDPTQQECGLVPEVVLYATFAIVPLSNKVHDVKLPVGAWDSPSPLEPYESAEFDSWSEYTTCPGSGGG